MSEYLSKRPCGRPEGLPKTGGRHKGTLNKTTQAKAQALAQALIAAAIMPEQLAELTPLAVMQKVMRGRFKVGDHMGVRRGRDRCTLLPRQIGKR
jgi:hypothetical protein